MLVLADIFPPFYFNEKFSDGMNFLVIEMGPSLSLSNCFPGHHYHHLFKDARQIIVLYYAVMQYRGLLYTYYRKKN